MKPRIEAMTFGSITIDGQKIRNDHARRLRLWNEAQGKVIGLFHVTC
jgi:hypothetical protein